VYVARYSLLTTCKVSPTLHRDARPSNVHLSRIRK
jgi:hypothetical protein